MLNVASTPEELWGEADRGLRIPFFGRTEETQIREKGLGVVNFLRRKKQADDAGTTRFSSAATPAASSRSATKKCPVPAFILDMMPKDENDYLYDEPTTGPLHTYTEAQPEESAKSGKCPVPAFLHNFLPHNGHGHSMRSSFSSRQQQQQNDLSVPAGRIAQTEALSRVKPFFADGQQERHDLTSSSREARIRFPTTSLPSFLGNARPQVTKTKKTITFSPLEEWAVLQLDDWYQQSQSLHCPFFRRRTGDALDAVESFIKHAIVRPECWPLMGEPQSCRDPKAPKMVASQRPSSDKHRGMSLQQQPQEQHQDEQKQEEQQNGRILAISKQRGLSLAEVEEILRADWRASTTDKGYYVTGRLTTSIYRNDCYFDGPDPDMPIRGLRKYIGVANNLFDAKKSKAKLLSLYRVKDEDGREQLIAHWQMQGVLKLPWRPEMPPIAGTTTYCFDADGLIERHIETWDVSPVHAFCHTLFPRLAKAVWGGGNQKGLIPAYQEVKTMTDEFIPAYHDITCGIFEF